MNKIKVIDLLNMISKGEEVPKKIAIQNDVLIYNEKYNLYLQDYYYMSDEEDATWKIWAYKLNDEVEILEEENKIPENNFNYIYSCEDEYIMANFENIKTTLKDIIDYLKSKGE